MEACQGAPWKASGSAPALIWRRSGRCLPESGLEGFQRQLDIRRKLSSMQVWVYIHTLTVMFLYWFSAYSVAYYVMGH